MTPTKEEFMKVFESKFMENIQKDLTTLNKLYEEDIALSYNRAIYGSEYPNISDETLNGLLEQNKYLNGLRSPFVDNEIV